MCLLFWLLKKASYQYAKSNFVIWEEDQKNGLIS